MLAKDFKEIKKIKFALVGQPNVGKSMLINSISNSRLRVGNFSGVTVAKEEVVFNYKGYQIEITDLPGSYSLNDYTQEEKVTKEFLDNSVYDIILNVLDSTNLERNLYLTSELLALDKKMIIVLNMIDEDKLPTKLIFSDVIEEEISIISKLFEDTGFKTNCTYRQLAIKLLKEDKQTYKDFHDEPFVMEMPKYRLPSLKLVWHTVSNQALMYLKKAGTYILVASLLIWFASNYPKYPLIEQEYNLKIEQVQNDEEKVRLQSELSLYNLGNSYLGIIGKFTQPVFDPLGFDWKMAVALETGLAAKEIVVSTLGILYGLGEENDENSQGLIEKIKNNIPLPSAIAFIIFVMIYLPCLAASMVFAKEAGGWKYLAYLFVFTTITAWTLSFVGYNLTRFIIT